MEGVAARVGVCPSTSPGCPARSSQDGAVMLLAPQRDIEVASRTSTIGCGCIRRFAKSPLALGFRALGSAFYGAGSTSPCV